MIAYLDASVILRLVLGESPVIDRTQFTAAVASTLTEVECLRTIDRLALTAGLPPSQVADRRASLFRLLEEVELVDVTRAVLRRASEPFPTPLGTLDAIHLATAVLWRDGHTALVMATHDKALATASRAMGLAVTGV
jgi:predicted nucleic acid-binding protein